MMGWSPTKKLTEYDNSILPLSPMKVGEGNPQAREEEGKLYLFRAQLIFPEYPFENG